MKTLTLLILACAIGSCSTSTAPSNSTQSTLPGYRGFPYLGKWQDGWLGELDTLQFTSASTAQWIYGGYVRNIAVTLATDSMCALDGSVDSTCIFLFDTVWPFSHRLHATDSSLQEKNAGGLQDVFRR